jgi:hypothetical protein
VKRVLFFVPLLMVSGLYADKGKIRIAADQQGAYVYVDGKKKAMTGEGFSSILLEEGEHTITVTKPIDERYEYSASQKVFVGEDTSTKLSFTLKQVLTAEGKALQAKTDASKLARWTRSGEKVTDTQLGLVWQDDSSAASTKKSWQDAQSYCTNLSLGGYSDWRLPNYDELLSIVDYDRYDPAIMPSFENVSTSGGYWSSSTYVSSTELAWVVDFKNGYAYDGTKPNEYYVRCVRGRQ